mmetsp:Transcript_4993/g.16229  ORF Transcript_4993/g.16229 Transcript_4993/m.16229 type:complete len:225 (-) Transcript_4993:412-1086(-)
MPYRLALRSASLGCGSTESARSADASSLTNSRGSTHSIPHWPCDSVREGRSRWRHSALKQPTGSCCCVSKARAWTGCSEPTSRRRSCSACFCAKAPRGASVTATSQTSSMLRRALRSAASSSAGRRTSRVPCWQSSDSSVHRFSSSSNSDVRSERDAPSAKHTPTSRAFPEYPFDPAVRPSRTAAMVVDASGGSSPSRRHSSSKAEMLPGEPRRESTHRAPSSE